MFGEIQIWSEIGQYQGIVVNFMCVCIYANYQFIASDQTHPSVTALQYSREHKRKTTGGRGLLFLVSECYVLFWLQLSNWSVMNMYLGTFSGILPQLHAQSIVSWWPSHQSRPCDHLDVISQTGTLYVPTNVPAESSDFLCTSILQPGFSEPLLLFSASLVTVDQLWPGKSSRLLRHLFTSTIPSSGRSEPLFQVCPFLGILFQLQSSL